MKDKTGVIAVSVVAVIGLGIVGYNLLQTRPPKPVAVVTPEPVEPPATVERSVQHIEQPVQYTGRDSLQPPRPTLEDCPAGVEVSYRVIDGKPVVEMPLEELESQIHAKVLCHAVNQMALLEYVAALENLIRIKR